jgi:DNA-binding MarR family transcriptional regulator
MATSTKAPAVAQRLRLENVLGYHLRRAQLKVFSDFTAAMEGLPLTPMLLGTLMIVDENPGINQSDIATALGADRSTLVRLVDQLEGLELVVRRPDPADRRSSIPTLTAEGRRVLDAALPRVAASEEALTSGLSEQERAALIAMLRRINS